MKVSLSGVARNGAATIKAMAEQLQELMDPEDWEQFECHHQPQGDAYMLEELSKHANETHQGKHSIEEFAVFYCLKEEEPKPQQEPAPCPPTASTRT